MLMLGAHGMTSNAFVYSQETKTSATETRDIQ